jgi:release factor glutamine methyltransferase
MRAHKASYEVRVLGITITVLPGVWSPAYDWSGIFMIANFPDVKGKDVLEIGCGSGLISVHAALSGARHVTAVDINPIAVENTRLNFSKFEIDFGSAHVSNGFAEVAGDFDVVVFNAPYHGCRPGDMLEYACADEDYQSLRAFFSDVRTHLRPDGLVELGFSESGDLKLFRSLIELHRFGIRRELSDWREGYNCMFFELSPEAD